MGAIDTADEKQNKPAEASEESSEQKFSLNLNDLAAGNITLSSEPLNDTSTVKRLFGPTTGSTVLDLHIDPETLSKAASLHPIQSQQAEATPKSSTSIEQLLPGPKIQPEKDPIKWELGYRDLGKSASEYWGAAGLSYLTRGNTCRPAHAGWLAPFGAYELTQDIPRLMNAQSGLEVMKYGLRTVADIGMVAALGGIVAKSNINLLTRISLASGISKMVLELVPDRMRKIE